jgi:hypothetical protein
LSFGVLFNIDEFVLNTLFSQELLATLAIAAPFSTIKLDILFSHKYALPFAIRISCPTYGQSAI